MTIFNGHTNAGILVLNQNGGVTNMLYQGQTPGSFVKEGVVLDSSFRSGEQRGPNVEVALYGSNCEVTLAGHYEVGNTLLNGSISTVGNYNALVVKKADSGYVIVRLVNGSKSAFRSGKEEKAVSGEEGK